MKILHIITSPAKDRSYSIRLGNALTEQLLDAHPQAALTVRDFTVQPLPHHDVITSDLLGAESDYPGEQQERDRISAELIAELFDHDIIVIGVPMYNFGIPSTLKSWIDYICKAGKTFRYNENGEIEGLVTGKKVFLAIASGNVYTDPQLRMHDHTENYLRTVLGWFLGMDDITAVRVEGVLVPGIKETALEKAISNGVFA